MIRALVALILAAFATQVAAGCRDVEYRDMTYSICEVDIPTSDLRLFLNTAEGRPLGQFSAVEKALNAQGFALAFAMNAGMYHSDRAPVGLFIENGREVAPLVTRSGPGNFGMVPNGVFCVTDGRADVIETRAFQRRKPECRFATQSGPMLVIDGALHPRFLKDSTSRYVRNGVGTTADGKRAVFAISRRAVTFHEFGSLFRDYLKLPNALYFDGSVSRLYAPELNRNDLGFALGPMVGLVVPKPH